jgi:hypothetical protein
MDANDRMEKQMEGTNLALAAVAEVLQKMDSRLRKEEEDSEEEELEKAAVASRQDLVKSIANEVIGVLKSELNGMDVSGDERKAAGTGGTPADADDSESAVTPKTKIEDQQNTIQAMLKNDDEESEEEEAEKGGYGMKQEDEDEYPVAEDPGDEGDSDELKAMKSQLDAMKKQLEAYESGMQKAIQDESENRLRKMGFAESTTLKAPASLMNLGTDDVAPIQKGSDSSDFMEDLTNVSYGELRKLQHQIEMGETDGLPRELIGG